MDKGYFTVEQISEMLNMHPKTIQRYIREGKLRAAKVGKGWRVSGHDLSVFMENAGTMSDSCNYERVVTVSSVVDITVKGADDAMRIMNALTGAFVSKPREFAKSSIRTQYIELENIVRVMLWGDMRFTQLVTEMIAAVTEL